MHSSISQSRECSHSGTSSDIESSMPRYKLTVAYEGTDFHGWQKQEPRDQAPLRTVQGVLERVVVKVVREPVVLVGASRTDSGVHALGQVAAFSTSRDIPIERLPRAITSRCPEDLQVIQAEKVPESFDPIRDAVRKQYCYTIQHGSDLPPLFDRRFIWRTHHDLEVDLMNQAAMLLVGTHDFESFASAHHGRENTIREILSCKVTTLTQNRLKIEVVGGGFLYNMVRIIAGSLLEIGRGAREPNSITKAIRNQDRRLTGPTLGPEGLRLEWIEYP